MAFILKYTATKNTWGGEIKAGESFTASQNSNAPHSAYIMEQLKNQGRKPSSSSSIGGGGLDVGETHNHNEWVIERIS